MIITPKTWAYLIIASSQLGVFLLENHPKPNQSHQHTMTHIPEHDRKQEGECNYGVHGYGDIR